MSASVFRLGFLLLSSPRKAPARVRLRGGRVIATARDPHGVHPELVYRCTSLQDWQALAEQTRDQAHLWPGMELVDLTTGQPRALTGTELVMLQADLAADPTPVSVLTPAQTPAPVESTSEPAPEPAATPIPPTVEAPVESAPETSAPVADSPAESPPVEPATPTLLERIAAQFATLPPEQQALGKSLTLTELSNALGVSREVIKETVTAAPPESRLTLTGGHYVKLTPAT